MTQLTHHEGGLPRSKSKPRLAEKPIDKTEGMTSLIQTVRKPLKSLTSLKINNSDGQPDLADTIHFSEGDWMDHTSYTIASIVENSGGANIKELKNLERAAKRSGLMDKYPDKACDIYFNIGLAFLKQGFRDEAIRYLKQAFRLTENNPETGGFSAANLAVLYAEKGMGDEAGEMYMEAISVNADPAFAADIQGAMAIRFIKRPDSQAEFSDSLDSLLYLLDLTPETACAHCVSVAHLLLEQGEFEKARECYKKVLRLRRANAKTAGAAAAGLADIAHREGNNDEAEKNYRSALRCNIDQFEPEAAAIVFLNLGLIQAERGDLDKAEKYFNRAIDLKQSNPEAAVQAAYNLRIIEERMNEG